MNDIFRELKNGVDFDSEHNDAYTVVSQMLVEWCEARGRCFSDLIIKIKVGDYEDTVFESFDSNNYCFVSDYDWWEGENTIQIIGIKRLEDVFDVDAKYSKAKSLLRMAVEQMAEVGDICDCVCSKYCPLDECGKFTFNDQIMELIKE
jgi:hypothetical protein